MTLTTLEPVQLEDHDLAVECNMGGCSAAATQIIRTVGCIHLWCQPCTESALSGYSKQLPAHVTCETHPGWKIFCTKLSDFILSVDKL